MRDRAASEQAFFFLLSLPSIRKHSFIRSLLTFMKCMQACFTAAASCQNQLILKLLLPLLLLAVFPYSCFFFFLRSFFCAFVHGSQHYIYVYVFHLRSVVADLATTLARGNGKNKTFGDICVDGEGRRRK